MEELIIRTEKFETTSKKLNKELDGVIVAFRNNEKAGEKLASHLANIYNNELWKNGDEFVIYNDKELTKFGDVAGIFGIGAQHAYKLVKCYNLKYNEEVLAERLKDFKLSQIMELIRVDITDLVVLIDEELVKNTMTCAQIRKAVDAYKKGDEIEDVTDETDENAEETDEDTEDIDTGYKVIIAGTTFEIEDAKIQKEILKVLEKHGIIKYEE